MGKSRKRSRHSNTGYPYSVRVAHIHVVRPKVRRQSDSSLFIGDTSQYMHFLHGIWPAKVHKARLPAQGLHC